MQNNIKKYPDISKRVFIENFIAESGAKPNPKPTAVFMAGLPGVGKTEFTINLINIVDGTKAIRIDMDEIARRIKGYHPKEADRYRKPATRLLEGILDKVFEKNLEFVLDGTFGSKKAISNVERAAKHNYTIKIVYIIQDPKIAWNFTLARERIEHRSINMDGFIKTYFNTINNLLTLDSLMKKYDKITVDIVIKNEKNTIESWIPNIKSGIDNLLKTSYNYKTLKEHIND